MAAQYTLVTQSKHVASFNPIPCEVVDLPTVLSHDEVNHPIDLLGILRILKFELLAYNRHQAIT